MLYVVTAVHNRYQITERFVKQIKKQTFQDVVLVLVDDGSTDGTNLMVRELLPNSVILQGNGKLWWGGALHKAYKWLISQDTILDSDYVMFANDDTSFEEDYLQKAISLLKENKRVLLTGYGYSLQTGKLVDGVAEYDYDYASVKISEETTGNCASTRSLFFTIKDLRIIGGFHPVLLPHYGSDYEWTIRACRKYSYQVIGNKSLFYYANEETTGDNQYDKLTRKKIFSKRSMSNPIYKFSFVILSAPPGHKLKAFYFQLKRDIDKVQVFRSIIKK